MSSGSPENGATVRFGIFEVDLRSGELRKAGVRVPLQDQPFRILVKLLEQPGMVVTRDELREQLWAADTFVGFEHGLNAAIKRLRDALGDSADTPRFVETLPRRGYRFIAPVQGQRPPASDDGRAAPRRRPRLLRRGLAVTSLIAVAAVAAVGLSELHRPPALTDRDTIVLSDFANTTGENIFDGTLQQALTIQLEQSPFLNLVSSDRLGLTLQEMTRPPGTRIAGNLAQEVCRRAGGTFTIDGSIARLGTHYLIGLEARQCEGGRSVAAEQIEVADREHVLEGLDRAATRLRGRLGEARGTLERFNTHLSEATTGSLEALQAFTVAEETRARRGDLAAEPLYERAIELDSDFALAHARLSAIYQAIGRRQESKRALDRAVRLRNRVTERERLYIDGRRCLAIADGDCYVNVYEVWTQTYPRDTLARENLCALYVGRGNFDGALAQCLEAVRGARASHVGYVNLASVYMAVGRFDDARKTTDQAVAQRLDAPQIHVSRFLVGFVLHDDGLMSAERQALAGQPEEYRIAGAEVQAASFEGRFTAARQLMAQADQIGARFGEWRANLRADETLVEAAAGFSQCGDEPTTVERSQVTSTLAIAAVLCGDRRRAGRLLEAWRDFVPTSWSWLFLAPTRTLAAVAAGDVRAAEQLSPPAPQDIGTNARYRPAYLRGLIYLRTGDARKAATEFQRITDHRGIDPTSGLYPLSWAQLARAYAMAGDTANARAAYERFFELWKDADRDAPILTAAKAEYPRLPAHGTSHE